MDSKNDSLAGKELYSVILSHSSSPELDENELLGKATWALSGADNPTKVFWAVLDEVQEKYNSRSVNTILGILQESAENKLGSFYKAINRPLPSISTAEKLHDKPRQTLSGLFYKLLRDEHTTDYFSVIRDIQNLLEQGVHPNLGKKTCKMITDAFRFVHSYNYVVGADPQYRRIDGIPVSEWIPNNDNKGLQPDDGRYRLRNFSNQNGYKGLEIIILGSFNCVMLKPEEEPVLVPLPVWKISAEEPYKKDYRTLNPCCSAPVEYGILFHDLGIRLSHPHKAKSTLSDMERCYEITDKRTRTTYKDEIAQQKFLKIRAVIWAAEALYKAGGYSFEASSEEYKIFEQMDRQYNPGPEVTSKRYKDGITPQIFSYS